MLKSLTCIALSISLSSISSTLILYTMSNQPNNKQVSIMALACVTVIAVTMMVLTAMMNVASAQTTMSGKPFKVGKYEKPGVGNLGMGVSVLNDMAGMNFEFSFIQEGENKGFYGGLEVGNSNQGANDFFSFYGGRAYRLFKNSQFRIGVPIGSGSRGNSVWDLTPYGAGYLVGTDGADSFLIGVETGFMFPVADACSLSIMAGQTTVGSLARLTVNLYINDNQVNNPLF